MRVGMRVRFKPKNQYNNWGVIYDITMIGSWDARERRITEVPRYWVRWPGGSIGLYSERELRGRMTVLDSEVKPEEIRL